MSGASLAIPDRLRLLRGANNEGVLAVVLLALIVAMSIANPVFFAQRDWLPDPPGWSSNIVRGKMYDTGENAGAQIWSHVLPLMARGLEAHRAPSVAELPIAQEPWSTVRRARPDAAPPWPGLIPRRGDRCLSTPLRDDW